MLCIFKTEARPTLPAVMLGITGGQGARHIARGEVLSCGDHEGPSMFVFTDVRGPHVIPLPSQPTAP